MKKNENCYYSAQEILDVLSKRLLCLLAEMEELTTKPIYYLRPDWMKLQAENSEVYSVINFISNPKGSEFASNPYYDISK